MIPFITSGGEAGIINLAVRGAAITLSYQFIGVANPGGMAPLEGRKVLESRRKKRDLLVSMIEEGMGYDEMAQRIGVTSKTLRNYISAFNLLDICPRESSTARHGPPRRIRPGLADLVEEGLSLEEMGALYDVTRAGMSWMIGRAGLSERWWAARDRRRKGSVEIKEGVSGEIRHLLGDIYLLMTAKQAEIKDLGRTLATIAYSRCAHDDALRSSLDYFFAKPRRGFDPVRAGQVYSLFAAYHRARSEGRVMSLEKLGEASGIHFASVSKMLSDASLPPMNGARTRHMISGKERDLVRLALECDTRLSMTDIAKYIGVNAHVIRRQATLEGTSKKANPPYASFGEGAVSYHRCMELFEAVDAGFTQEESMRYAGINTSEAYHHIMRRRNEIQSEVGNFLESVGRGSGQKTIRRPTS